MGITESIVAFAVNFVEGAGYLGLLVLMVMESTFMPIPSEAVMPPAGFLIEEGKFNFPAVIFFATLGSIVGSLISYGIGSWGGKPFIDKFGKYLLLDSHHLAIVQHYFNRWGNITILVGRFIPVVRHLISLPAGIGKMNLLKFILYTIIGAGAWNALLAYAGYVLKSNWTEITKYSHIGDVVVLTLIAAAVLYYGYRIYNYWRGRNKS